MKKTRTLSLLLLFLLLLVGCSQRTEEQPQETNSHGEVREYCCAVPVLTETELAERVLSLSETDALTMGASLFYDGAAIPCLLDKATYYLTVDENSNGWGGGNLTASTGVSLAFCEADVQTPRDDYMKNGIPCVLYAYTDTAYAPLRLIFTTLPVMTLENDEKEVNRGERECEFTLFQPRSGETKAVQYVAPATIRVRGATSADLTKKGYALELYKEGYEDTQKLPLLGMRKDDDWVLYPAHSDEAKIRDAVAWHLWREIGAYAAEGGAGSIDLRYIEVILNGEYFGMYLLMERMDEKTLNLDEDDTLFKATSWEVPSSDAMRAQTPRSPICGGLEKKYPDPTDEVDGSWDIMADFIELTYEAEGKVFAASIADCADVENMLDYWLFINLIMGDDNRYKNTYYATIDGKVYAFPWDLDISFGLAWGADKPNYLFQYPNYASAIFNFNCGRRLIKYCPGAATYVKNRWKELTERGVVTYDGIMAVAESYWSLIHDSGAYERNRARWPDGNYVDDLEYFSHMVKRRVNYLTGYLRRLEDAA